MSGRQHADLHHFACRYDCSFCGYRCRAFVVLRVFSDLMAILQKKTNSKVLGQAILSTENVVNLFGVQAQS